MIKAISKSLVLSWSYVRLIPGIIT